VKKPDGLLTATGTILLKFWWMQPSRTH
jgi:hypothetical protein